MEMQKESSDGEDIPSDFFDDFAKDEFLEGLSVIDTWDSDDNKPENSCVEPENLDGVRDLRELIARERKEQVSEEADRHSSHSKSHLDDFIKPGSRRDPNKTNRAIKKDKELKVKEYLAKHLESTAELCPPGTELDDFFEENKTIKKKEQLSEERLKLSSPTQVCGVRSSPLKSHREPKYSPQRRRRTPQPRHRNSPERYPISPGKFRASPGRFRTSPGRFHTSPGRFHTSPGRFHTSPGRVHISPGKFHTSPGRFRESPGRFPVSTGRYHHPSGRFRHPSGRFRGPLGRQHDVSTRHHESPTRPDRRHISSTYRKSPPTYRHVHPRHGSGRRSRSPHLFPGHRKERRYSSPRGSPTRTIRRDRSPRSPRESYRRSHSHSPRNKRDDFLYPDTSTPNYNATNPTFEIQPQSKFPGPTNMDYYVEPAGGPVNTSIGPQVPQPYSLPQIPAYAGFNPQYPYPNQPPLPVPAPIIPGQGSAGFTPVLHSPHLKIDHVTHNTPVSKIGLQTTPKQVSTEPADALAKLVADGKLSHEDYLKLAPNKGALQQMDTNTRVGDVCFNSHLWGHNSCPATSEKRGVDDFCGSSVLNRCHSAMTKLGDLLPANRLIVGKIKKQETMKAIGPKFCSPLKKKLNVEFNFTKISVSGVEFQNKQIIDTIISSLELHKVVGRPKKKKPNYDVRDVAVQTSNPQCDLCVIRKATLVNEVGTSIDPEHFSSTTHTQVVEEDLQNSKTVFNPSGSSSDGAPISFAHMTSAQLVSQLVARAKTLKQSDAPPSNQFQGRGYYDGRGGSHNYRNNYNNYRY